MHSRLAVLGGLALAALAGCSQPDPVITVEPMSDKFGNLFCPDGYVLQVNQCVLPTTPGQPVYRNGGQGGTGTGTQPGTTPGTQPGGNQNQNTNQNTNQNQNNNQNQSGQV
ncbi:hypothetical protein [Thetidibacter halocola]|uniref:Lipoprotein n=1 Tax=Thetidibacter halocola TaxID=2827239 RepID=A0A8J7WCR9_9RHOB|nr:hypothetical protein [Thetidibacter halocola]MBS0125195.1 hypothetical protein [Thetidibacter halocola]